MNKVLTGELRIGVSSLLTLRALEELTGVSPLILRQKVQGNWQPSEEFYNRLFDPSASLSKDVSPYPFFLAMPYLKKLENLGNPAEWCIESKWDGIRAQLVIRKPLWAIWSRSLELITSQFPEFEPIVEKISTSVVLDGELLAYSGNHPLPFSHLQRRLGRKSVTPKLVKEIPVVFMAYDLLEIEDKDIRSLPLKERRALLYKFMHDVQYERLLLSMHFPLVRWEEAIEKMQSARKNYTEGLMLKKWDSPYLAGRKRGYWWKYKIDPLTIDAVLLYAEPGKGRRAALYTDYTFAVWNEGELVPIAKAYSGLAQEEIETLDRWIRKNTIEKFGPVRKVKCEHVFEIAFEAIQLSNRHKSGVALRFPRILRWRKDKTPEMADQLKEIRKLIT